MKEYLKLTCEDNLDFMSRYEDNYFDLAIVDPPYGGNDAIGLKNNKGVKKQATKRTNYKVFKNVEPSEKYFKELIRVSRHQIIWGVNFYKNYSLIGGRLVWDKKGTAFGRAEMAYLSMTKSVNICEVIWNGMLQQDMKNKETRIHPTQKPVALYQWLLKNYAKPGDKILDTHLGSMSIAIAVDSVNKIEGMNLTLTGCELDPEYYAKGIERVENETKWESVFQDNPITEVEQIKMFEDAAHNRI